MLVLSGQLGAAAPTYKCNSTICYGADGTGATHALFKETQYQINRAGKAFFGTSWSSIPVDGFIGSKTLSAARKLFPKIAALVSAGYSAPTYFADVAKYIAASGAFIPDALRRAADQKTGQAQNPSQISTRQAAYASEGPAKSGTAAQLPAVDVPVPSVQTPATNQQPADATAIAVAAAAAQAEADRQAAAGKKMSTGAKVAIGVTAVVAVVGLVAAAAYATKKRRRR